jgi:high-affinity nickel-transport protein
MMAGAYRWAISEPLRKLHCNLAITLASVVVAVGIGTVELLGLAAGEQPSGGFSQVVAALNDNLTLIGASIVVLFGLSWAISVAAARAAPAHPTEVAAGSAARARLSPSRKPLLGGNS